MKKVFSWKKAAVLVAQVALVVGIAAYVASDFKEMEARDYAFQQSVVSSYPRK